MWFSFMKRIVKSVLIFSAYIAYDKNHTVGKIEIYLEQKEVRYDF